MPSRGNQDVHSAAASISYSRNNSVSQNNIAANGTTAATAYRDAGPAKRQRPVYEVVAGRPAWSRLSRLATENVAQLAARAITRAVKTKGRTGCEQELLALRQYLTAELPASALREVLDVCVASDRFRCHHNPTDCLALELWRVFYSDKLSDVNVVHHEFAFPKTSNYPEIVQNLDRLLRLMSSSSSPATVTSFKLELKQCEVGFFLEDRLAACLTRCSSALRVLEIPGLASDRLLDVIAKHCTNLEILGVRGSREQVSDRGFARFAAAHPPSLRQLDISRCCLTQQSLLALKELSTLTDLRLSTTLLDEINCVCDGGAVLLAAETGEPVAVETLALPGVLRVSVENDSCVQVSINQVMSYLRGVFPSCRDISLVNCIACELHVTLTQHPTNITYMRETIQSLELISADYFNFPRLVYPCPNLESLAIEKPSNDVFNVDQQNVPFLYGNTVPFINLRHLKLSRISLTNLTHFLSQSHNLRKFKVTNIGRRERPRWTDCRIRQILPPDSVPHLEEFHVSCLPSEGFSTSDTHRFLHLTGATIRYLAENFAGLKSIGGIESWAPRDCDRASLCALLNSEPLSGKFSVVSI